MPRNSKQNKKGRKNKNTSSSHGKPEKLQNSEERKLEAENFIKNLGPEGYFKTSDTLSKDVSVPRYSMSSPDGATCLLSNTDIKFSFGRKYGLVGKNGFGKTTLLRNLASYSVEGFPTHIRMVHVEQEQNKNDTRTVLNAVLESDVIRTQLISESERLEELMYTEEDEDKIEATQQNLDRITSYMQDLQIEDSYRKAFNILVGLGFSKEMQKQAVNSLSGGWRMRVELAKALFVSPDLLLLDEPTNHLDFPAVLWLQEYLINEFSKTLVIVSHDKMFLSNVITNVIHLNHKNQSLDYYKGNYEAFETALEENWKTMENAYRAYEFQINSIKEFVEKFRDKGEKRAAQVQSKLKTLKKLQDKAVEKPTKDKPFAFSFPSPSRIEQEIISTENLFFGYSSDRIILQDINLTVDMDSRIGVIGENGVGKSTLIKLMLQSLTPVTGHVNRNRHARVTYFSQHHYDQLNLSQNAVEYFLQKFSTHLEEQKDTVQFVRRHLGRFGIKGDRQNQKMKFLSGGQKSRVAFASMTFLTPHFIVMDEPTNHLDLETIDALIDAIERFEGGILAISHDTHFLSKIANRFWLVTRDKIERFDEFDSAKEFALRKRVQEVSAF